MQNIERPTQLKHHVEIARVGLMRHLQVLQRVPHVAGLHAALGHCLGVGRGGLCFRLRAQHLRQAQYRANAIRQLIVVAGQNAVEERPGSILLASRVE